MLYQIQILPESSIPNQQKGDFFEDLMRRLMETQRYEVVKRLNFTGTEIDLLCQHLDRHRESAIVECKAKITVNSDDIKKFAFDVVVSNISDYGYFVFTNELQHQAAGLRSQLESDYPKRMFFWGPKKVIELLLHQNYIVEGNFTSPSNLVETKRILLYSYRGVFWLRMFSDGMIPTHFMVSNANNQGSPIDSNTLGWISNLDEMQGLEYLPEANVFTIKYGENVLDSVAEIQEAITWDDYRPVGMKYFVGRKDIRNHLYRFIMSAANGSNLRRVFFIEGKSGWGKSSLLAELRSRARNKRNRNTFFVLAVDSRSANTSEFLSLSVAKLIAKAADATFVPSDLADITIASSFNVLASDDFQRLLSWLRSEGKILVLIFDQFEDVFRKDDLFRAFHKLMVDAHEEKLPIVVGFSWKSEINIPIDNPAYSLWQQARDIADTFYIEEFLGYEIDAVIGQLAKQSGHRLPSDLKRRLKESSQGFPWLTKKLAIHCYHQMQHGILPEELADQNLNVLDLFENDLEILNPNEARALKFIAERGYSGNSVDVAEIDDKIQELEINSLLNKRLIIRSGSKYNVYWDVFRDYIVEGSVPSLGENFLIRQFPKPCVAMLELLLRIAPCSIETVLDDISYSDQSDGTALNQIRELRQLGVVKKENDEYSVRVTIADVSDFREFISDKLRNHNVVKELEKISADVITHKDVMKALKENFRGYDFSEKTWSTYASYFIAWLRYVGIEFGNRLVYKSKSQSTTSFTPQRRPEKDFELFQSIKYNQQLERSRQTDKGLYDLKAMGLVTYDSKGARLTKRGINLAKLDVNEAKKSFAMSALELSKLRTSYNAYKDIGTTKSASFDSFIEPILEKIESESYRKVTKNILKSWAKFIYDQIDGPLQPTLGLLDN